jgi:hypothetical protein
MAGIGLQRCLYEGCDVKIKSSVFSFLVGKSTICSKPLSDAISRYVWFVISLWKKANIYKIQEDLIVFGENFRDQTFDSIENMWNHFKTAVKRIIGQRVPTKMTRARHTHPWLSSFWFVWPLHVLYVSG